jgi:hypothetical protein
MSTISSEFSIRGAATVLLALPWLCGCGPTSVTSLRESPHRVYSFVAAADYETVYLRIARRAQERYRYTNLATYQPGVSAKLFPDRQSATVTLLNAGGIGMRYVLTADLHALDPSRTEVTLYCATRSSTKEAALWQQWANTPLDAGQDQSSPQIEEKDPKDVNDLKAHSPSPASRAMPLRSLWSVPPFSTGASHD